MAIILLTLLYTNKQDRELNWIAERENLQNCDLLTYLLTFVFQGIAERSSAIQKVFAQAGQ